MPLLICCEPIYVSAVFCQAVAHLSLISYDITKRSLPCFRWKRFLQKCWIIMWAEGRDTLIIDLREKESYMHSHVKGAVNMPYGEIDGYTAFPKGKILVLYCDRGGASLLLARQLAKLGYCTRSVIGGFGAYRGRNLVISP